MAGIGRVKGRAGSVTVFLDGLTFRETDAGRRFPYPDFGSQFIEALHRRLVVPRRRGLLRSTLACSSCDASLTGVAPQPIGIATEVDLGTIAPIQVDLALPGLVCPRCRAQMAGIHDRAVESDLSDALIAAFDAAGMKPG